LTEDHIGAVIDELARDFSGTFSRETIARYVMESFTYLTGARVTAYVPILLRRFATERLRAYAQAQGLEGKEVPEVLFVCVRNAGRSQMAAALLARDAGGKAHARSAGSVPGEGIDAQVREVMAEIGVHLSDAYPKPLTDEVVAAADVVVTMGCGDACPILLGKRYEDWDVPDPAGRDIDDVRRIRDEIARRVRWLTEDLVRAAP
jgi:protein-tyrosine-phosphatase